MNKKLQNQEKWIPWNPANRININYEKVSFLESDEQGAVITCINFKNKKEVMKIIFRGGGFVSYRYTNESYMFLIGRAASSEESFAYKVLNSNYIAWLAQVSDGLSDSILPKLQHFVFVSSDDYLEVLCDYDPEIIFETLP